MVAVQHLPAGDDGAGVVQVGVQVDEPRGGHHALGDPPGELVQRPQVLLDKALAHQEVLGRIAGDGQLGVGDEVGARIRRPLQGVGHLLDVPPDVADGGVDLGQRNPHALNISRLAGSCLPMFMPVERPARANLRIESHAMPARKRTPADAGALAAGLLVDACGPHAEDSLRLEVVRDLALDLGRRLEVLAGEDFAGDSLVEAALACADLATLAACNLPALPDGDSLSQRRPRTWRPGPRAPSSPSSSQRQEA